MKSYSYTPWNVVLAVVRTWTAHEIAGMWQIATDREDHHQADTYLEALSVHACRSSWGELIEASINNRKEVDSGTDQDDQARVLD